MRVIVVGAGPGGATAALALARSGAEVTLVERSVWPRPKTCGDGISPLALREGRELGLSFEGDVRLQRAFVTTPHRQGFRGGWPAETPWGTTIERSRFDAAIVEAAANAGAEFLPGTDVRAIGADPRGAKVTLAQQGAERSVTSDAVVIAEGATGGLAAKLGFGKHRSRLVAIRGYVRTDRPLVEEYGLFYDAMLTPGYGWIFPMNAHRANVGIAVDERTLARHRTGLRVMLRRWLDECPFALDLLGASPQLEDLKGGIIPTGRRKTGPRTLLVGDAAGVADPFTAEGIFQAIHSARLAARALAESPDLAQAAARYERDARVFDRNERAARGLRATFGPAIEICARHARKRPSFGDYLNTAVFFSKSSFGSFVAGLIGAW